LLNSPEWKQLDNGELEISFLLPRQGVSLVRITY